MAETPAAKRSPDIGGILAGGLIAVTSALGYLALLAVVISAVLTSIYGAYSKDPNFLRVSNWLVELWLACNFFGIVTVPVSLILAAVASFLPILRRTKIIIWIIAAGGGVAWLIGANSVLGGKF